MACIYHITSTKDSSRIYIGQTTQDPESRNEIDESDGSRVKSSNNYNKRPMDHFSGLYYANQENPMFLEFVRDLPLSSMQVTIYSEDQTFGLEPQVLQDFCDEWFGEKFSPEVHTLQDAIELKNKKSIKYDLQHYLDAAEIIHNYIAHKIQHKKVMSYQIGGQTYALTSRNGTVLNTTMSIEAGCNAIDSASDLTNIEQEFKKELSAALTDSNFINELSSEIAGDIISWQLENGGSDKKFRFTSALREKYMRILATYIRKALIKVQHGYAANILRGRGYQILTKYDNLYSQYLDKWLFNFNGSQHYNIIDAMIRRLASQNLGKKWSSKKVVNVEDIIQEIADTISDKVSIIVPETSVGSFFDIIPPKDVITPKQWSYHGGIIYSATDTTSYGLSFRRRAYWFFRRAVADCWQNDPEINRGALYPYQGDQTIQRITTYRLSNALYRYFKKVKNQDILDNWPNYLHSMLTIYTKNNGVTIGGKPYIYDVVDGRGFLITDQEEEIVINDQVATTVMMAYRFSPETMEAMQKWQDKNVEDLDLTWKG